MAPELNIIDTAIKRGTFRVFTRLLQGSLLESRLRSEASFTLFAPTDIAFAKLSTVTLKWLLQPQNEDRLDEILRYHVVPGSLESAQLEQITTARSEQGQELRIELQQTLLIDSAKVIFKDIRATNGVIHGIEGLLMPATIAIEAV
jgi:uncharacterized surface protein with fasciclin (FAS1) repeats